MLLLVHQKVQRTTQVLSLIQVTMGLFLLPAAAAAAVFLLAW